MGEQDNGFSKIPLFDGTGDVLQFITQFQQSCDQRAWGAARCGRAMIGALRGTALQSFQATEKTKTKPILYIH